MTTTAFIGIGSNVGDRGDFVRKAVELLGSDEAVTVESVSSLYETSPVGGPPQRSFINAVAKINTTLPPRELLSLCQEIERALGREESEIRWGPRVVDLDLLLYGDEKINEPDLEVPHPRMSQRRFVLVPLLEVEPNAVDPWGGPFAEWLDEAEGEVRPIEPF